MFNRPNLTFEVAIRVNKETAETIHKVNEMFYTWSPEGLGKLVQLIAEWVDSKYDSRKADITPQHKGFTKHNFKYHLELIEDDDDDCSENKDE